MSNATIKKRKCMKSGDEGSPESFSVDARQDWQIKEKATCKRKKRRKLLQCSGMGEKREGRADEE